MQEVWFFNQIKRWSNVVRLKIILNKQIGKIKSVLFGFTLPDLMEWQYSLNPRHTPHRLRLWACFIPEHFKKTVLNGMECLKINHSLEWLSFYLHSTLWNWEYYSDLIFLSLPTIQKSQWLHKVVVLIKWKISFVFWWNFGTALTQSGTPHKLIMGGIGPETWSKVSYRPLLLLGTFSLLFQPTGDRRSWRKRDTRTEIRFALFRLSRTISSAAHLSLDPSSCPPRASAPSGDLPDWKNISNN